ncbi:potassium transporter Kup [Prosthecobacter sp.]|uniref:potassium transporter Kup n=1 Tax=Prosthecobacter sp. TaxID=1965333 RepID=UPI002487BB13|nr:potassium transporter Kup [Prosthecobacter sp.]MDI1311631.1 potassium transporter Kup [Prosthecobacter sp.]
MSDPTDKTGLQKQSATTLVIAALGVVFGDIGTSPIYTLKECFSPYSPHHVAATHENLLGVVSLVLWALIVLVCIKYLVFVLRADNKGEGGVLSLMALASHGMPEALKRRTVIVLLGLFGAALLFGDGIITPAISVLSAVEGLKDGGLLGKPPTELAETLRWDVHMEWLIMGITIVILIVLFSVQFLGTARMGRFFGPITGLWFLTLAGLGVSHLIQGPEILVAFNPWHGWQFLTTGGHKSFVILGSVFLAVTGGEALYADMGHFGAGPIRRGWFSLVLPALALNYLGQGAMLMHQPELAQAPFFQMAPAWAILPLVLLATAATVIASQALITGTYSLTLSAVQLGYLPRLSIRHTSAHARGQIYIPLVNWLLMLACITLVLAFRNSTNLAAAYGVAVTMTMLITTFLFYFAARHLWRWSLLKTLSLCLMFAVIEIAFLSANLVKFFDGGWFPLVVGAVIFTIMTTWATGRRLVRDAMAKSALSQETLCQSIKRSPPVHVPGTAIFMTSTHGRAPIALLHSLKHYQAIHERVIFMTLITEDEPWVPPSRRVAVENISRGFWRVTGRYGFMQKPDVPRLLRLCSNQGLEVEAQKTTFFLGREIIVSSSTPGMVRWREHLFAFTSKLAQQPATYFQIPVGRVIELGQQVEI